MMMTTMTGGSTVHRATMRKAIASLFQWETKATASLITTTMKT
jgi:hypothetical protein